MLYFMFLSFITIRYEKQILKTSKNLTKKDIKIFGAFLALIGYLFFYQIIPKINI